MIYLVTLHTGALRLIASQQESLSGGALQFYVRAGASHELRLNQALAPSVWKDCRAITTFYARSLIAQGEAEVDHLVHKDLEGKLSKAPPSPPKGEGSRGEGQKSSKPIQPKPEGWKNITLGNDSHGHQVSLMWGRYGPFLKVKDRNSDASQIINLPNGESHDGLTLTRALDIIRASRKTKK